MLEITGRTVAEYAGRHGCHYERFVGVLRGEHPWQATFNRIMLIERLLRAGTGGWLIYLDADAYVASMCFDLREYLADKSDYALIAAASGAEPVIWWNLNDGVFMLNLEHEKTREIVDKWLERFMAITDAQLKAAYTWNMISGGQAMLQRVLAEGEGYEQAVLVDQYSAIMNSPTAAFVRQVLRAEGSVGYRMNRLRAEIANALGQEDEAPTQIIVDSDVRACNEEFMRAIYYAILLREPDPSGYAASLERLATNATSYARELTSFLKSDEFGRKLPIFLQVYQGHQDYDELLGHMAASRWRSHEKQRVETNSVLHASTITAPHGRSKLGSLLRRRAASL